MAAEKEMERQGVRLMSLRTKFKQQSRTVVRADRLRTAGHRSYTMNCSEAEVGITGTTAAIAAGASVASLGMKAGSDVASGYAKKQELDVKAQNAILESTAKATNYRYQGEQQQTQFDIEAGKDTMLASHAETAAEFGELQAGMTDAAARRNLSTTLGNITTMRAAGGADFTSPTTAALRAT
jgi:hypothetical protein